MTMFNKITIIGAAAVLSTAASAATVALIDVNGMAAQYTAAAGGAFGTGATGSIHFFTDSNTVLAGVAVDGVNQTLTAGLQSINGTINLVGGVVQGGAFTITATDATSYVATIVAGIGEVAVQAGQGFSIDGLTFNGLFSGPTFAGANISDFFSAQPLTGSFLQFAFRPNAGGFDQDSDLDVFVSVPLPSAAGLAFAGLAGITAARRRR